MGDGPWSEMRNFDDNIPKRKFDNFQFVDFHKVVSDINNISPSIVHKFTVEVLQEIPKQFEAISKGLWPG